MIAYGAMKKSQSKGNCKPIHNRPCVICYPPQKAKVSKSGAKRARQKAKKELRGYY